MSVRIEFCTLVHGLVAVWKFTSAEFPVCQSCVNHVSIMCQSCVNHVSIMCQSCVNHVSTMCTNCVNMPFSNHQIYDNYFIGISNYILHAFLQSPRPRSNPVSAELKTESSSWNDICIHADMTQSVFVLCIYTD